MENATAARTEMPTSRDAMVAIAPETRSRSYANSAATNVAASGPYFFFRSLDRRGACRVLRYETAQERTVNTGEGREMLLVGHQELGPLGGLMQVAAEVSTSVIASVPRLPFASMR
jgi:hypothetical protein